MEFREKTAMKKIKKKNTKEKQLIDQKWTKQLKNNLSGKIFLSCIKNGIMRLLPNNIKITVRYHLDYNGVAVGLLNYSDFILRIITI